MSTAPTVSLPDDSPRIRWTWITVLLVLYHLLFILPSLRPATQPPQEAKHLIATRFLVLLVQWLGFYIAVRGIHASNLTFAELFGKHRSPNRLNWNDCRDAFVMFLIILGVNLALAHIQPFAHSNSLHSHTLFQYTVTVFIAISAGIIEEVTYRGFFLTQFRVLTHSLRVAIFLQAALFALFHGFRQNLTLALSRFFIGILFAFFALRRESLWPAIVGHVFIDVLGITIQYFKYR